MASMQALILSLPLTTSRPPSVVTSDLFSGTMQTAWGLSFTASSVIAFVQAISRLSRVEHDSFSRQTSRSWMCLRSSRR
jgi:hypothetical protein